MEGALKEEAEDRGEERGVRDTQVPPGRELMTESGVEILEEKSITPELAVEAGRLETLLELPVDEFVGRLHAAPLTVDGMAQVFSEVGFDARHLAYGYLGLATQNRDSRTKLKALDSIGAIMGASGKRDNQRGGVNVNLFTASPAELEKIIKDEMGKLTPVEMGQ